MKNTLNKREGEKDEESTVHWGREKSPEERSILTPPTEAEDLFLFARLNKFPVSVSQSARLPLMMERWRDVVSVKIVGNLSAHRAPL